MNFTDKARNVLNVASFKALEFRHEFVTPEHVLVGLINDETFVRSLYYCEIDYKDFVDQIDKFMRSLEKVPEGMEYDLIVSEQANEMITWAEAQAAGAGVDEVDVPHIIDAILHLRDSEAKHIFLCNTAQSAAEIVTNVLQAYEEDSDIEEEPFEPEDFTDEPIPTMTPKKEPWRDLVTEITASPPAPLSPQRGGVDTPMGEKASSNKSHSLPLSEGRGGRGERLLIGREQELQRTIQVLCRKEKNNPLHVGEPGVGKTALVYGLAQMIDEGRVPENLLGHHIYMMDMGTMLAGTQFRGEFEKRIKQVMDGVRKEGRGIIYIDEIHNLIGAGKGSEGSMDASNMLKPYLESGDIRFIGSTTYQEYNRYFAKSRGIVRRFQQIDIAEPTQSETVEILKGLRSKYEKFHGITLTDDILQYVVEASAKHISDRFLPDKAIDIIDEAGAMKQIRNEQLRKQGKRQQKKVTRADVNDILARVCKIDAKALREEDNSSLLTLHSSLSSQIYGQDEAIQLVVEAVQMSKAGLLDDNKPIASLLFVGPTGVGKTEVAKVLAQELGIELVRFDMSEYTEKHAVSKLIGSPAGYVGYEDGGLLTDAVRKTPNCVLLLDEIEKAHADIYNILLQVMDYARLTDNRGQKADFRNVILILTSNAGAQYASQANVGFSGSVSKGEAMLTQVKKTFKPEFINRLSSIVTFNDMDRHMASLILDKKLRQLDNKLVAKGVTLTLTPEAREFLLQKGFSPKYGAREMDRIIQHHLNPLLMHEILFGKRKDITITLATDHLELSK